MNERILNIYGSPLPPHPEWKINKKWVSGECTLYAVLLDHIKPFAHKFMFYFKHILLKFLSAIRSMFVCVCFSSLCAFPTYIIIISLLSEHQREKPAHKLVAMVATTTSATKKNEEQTVTLVFHWLKGHTIENIIESWKHINILLYEARRIIYIMYFVHCVCFCLD